MAFLAELTAQAEELVTALTGTSSEHEPQTFGSLREATLRALRQQQHSYGRTNQFDVAGRLDGLAERFAVAGRDELADELQQRRARLADMASTAKWMPDVLSFLLELSDQPADLASLDALHALCASRIVHEPPPLRWEDIAREDGWGDELVPSWRSDGGGTTADEGTSEDDDDDDDDDEEDYEDDGLANSASDEDTTLSSVGTQEQQQQQQQARLQRDFAAEEHSAETHAALLQAIRASQSWRLPAAEPSTGSPGDGAVAISELQLLRETLFMLQGLDTTVFGVDYTPVPAYRLSGVSVEAHGALVASVAASGRKVGLLRRRAAGVASSRGGGAPRAAMPTHHHTSNVPLLQVFQEAIDRRLQAFDREVAAVQARFVAIQRDTVVSLVAVLDELQPSLACLAALSAVVERLEAERRHAHAFRYLELLFDAAALAQLEGDARLYAFLGTVFFDCFQVYLRPIRLWMEEGQLLDGDKIFFVAGAAAQMPLNQIWQHQYKLLRTSSGVLHAPKFLQPAALKIFTTGKSIVVLRQLGRSANGGSGSGGSRTKSAVASTGAPARAAEPTLDFATVCPPEAAMAPLAQLFSNAFARWIQSKHHAASATLQATLFDACGLWASLEALHGVYLMADGAAVDAFVSRVFQGLDTGSPRWHDRYTLTEQAREAFGARLDTARLSVAVADEHDAQSGAHSNDPAVARRSVRGGVARIRVYYRLAWPVQMIIPADCLTGGYQALFTLLLQVRRANSVLSRHRLLLDVHSGLADGDAAASVSAQGPAVATAAAAGDRALYFALRAKLVWFCNTLQSYLVTLVVAPRLAALQTDLQRRAVDVDAMIAVHAACLRGLVAEACLGTKLQPIHDALVDVLDLALRLEDARRAQAAREASALQQTWRLSVLASPFQPASASKRRPNAMTTPRSQAKTGVAVSPAGGSAVRRRLFAAAKTSPRRKQSGAIDDVFGKDGDRAGPGGHSDDDSDDDPQTHYAYDDDDDDDDDADDDGGDPEAGGGAGEVPQERYGDVLRSISSAFTGHLRFITGGLRGVARASSDATAAAKWDMLAEMLSDGSRGGW